VRRAVPRGTATSPSSSASASSRALRADGGPLKVKGSAPPGRARGEPGSSPTPSSSTRGESLFVAIRRGRGERWRPGEGYGHRAPDSLRPRLLRAEFDGTAPCREIARAEPARVSSRGARCASARPPAHRAAARLRVDEPSIWTRPCASSTAPRRSPRERGARRPPAIRAARRGAGPAFARRCTPGQKCPGSLARPHDPMGPRIDETADRRTSKSRVRAEGRAARARCST